MSGEKGEGLGAGAGNGEKASSLECMRPFEVARKLGISQKLVRRLLREKKLPGFKIGRVWVISKAHLEDYLKRLAEGVMKANPHFTDSIDND